MISLLRLLPAACFVAYGAFAAPGYHLVRIAPVLNQPTFVTQAPGDPPNILHYSTRISTALSGFSAQNTMGKIWRYDVNTRESTIVLDFSERTVVNDDGLQCFAFPPDFRNTESPLFGKIYVSSSQYVGGPALNLVEEFTILNPDGTPISPETAINTGRVILRYVNNSENNHTVDWIGFDPTATGEARNYLYISTGDGAFGRAYNGGSGTTGRPSQNPMDLKGKFLRVDVSGMDAYPSDPDRNYAIPASNPIPAYNALDPDTPINGLGEVYVTGVRNGYRASFDRVTGDLYWGDVGENAYEEVNFLKAGTAPDGPPADFGWPQWEGVHPSTVSGAPHTSTNPFTGVISFGPIREYPSTVGDAAIGGYVHRGPVLELEGRYCYADFVEGRMWLLDFDRDTPPASFNGTNGTLADVTALWNSLIVDPLVPTYKGDTSLGTLNGLDHIVSFGEDNAGNLYIVDFGFGTGFSGQYTANAGELFQVVPGIRLYWTNSVDGIQFWWPGGFQFRLQAQTNSLSSGMTGEWHDYPGGSFSPLTVPLPAAEETVFFRVIGL
ncbi:MAG TPA: PQQ-dependent sugar dehydrogenase [Verrucomicrobiota bacterium]|nr:PQQ-dependent sugar dehydrogenase [Verrucomicrobiota bacterium]